MLCMNEKCDQPGATLMVTVEVTPTDLVSVKIRRDGGEATFAVEWRIGAEYAECDGDTEGDRVGLSGWRQGLDLAVEAARAIGVPVPGAHEEVRRG
jgi:hypothetical protein